MRIRVSKPGMLTALQDLGRYRCAHLGISPAGAADARSFRIANLLVGNDENAPALEMTLLGARLEFEGSAVLSVTGANISSDRIPMWQAIEVPAGFMLDCGALTGGARTYVAVQGGFKVEEEIGSASTDVAGGFGGICGRALRAGDVLEVGDTKQKNVAVLGEELRRLPRTDEPIRVTKGLQWERFDQNVCERFVSAPYTVSHQSNRAGLRLTGEELLPRDRNELLTEGIPLGAIQVPPNGQPIILFVDQQTTGGYPKIANVIAADLHRIGQLRPGDRISFEMVSIKQAVTLLRSQERSLREALLS